jgi:16S rRNA (guanine527-N7)-methyltransferase
VADELIADAVPLAAVLREGDSLLDIGAGAGLPGLVVALLRADVRVELWEARERRCAFLRAASQATGASNVTVAQRRAPEREPFERLPYRALSARAVWPPAEWLRIAARLGQPGAHVMLNGAALPAPAGMRLEREVAYSVAALQRTLAVYEVMAAG